MTQHIPTITAHGATIPVIGYGTSGMGEVTPEHVATALKLGYRHIDTAWKYGTERAVGEGMRASGVPAARVQAVQAALMRTFKDPDFLAKAQSLQLETSAAKSGDQLRDIVARAYAVSAEVRARLRAM